MHLCLCHLMPILPIDLSHLQSVTLDRLIKSQFFPRHFESRGVGASFLRSTVTLSALSKGLVKRHGYRVKYPRSIPSRTKPCLQKQYLDSGRGHVHCVTPNCLQLATLLQLLSVSIYGYTTTTCAMQLYVLSLMLSDIL